MLQPPQTFEHKPGGLNRPAVAPPKVLLTETVRWPVVALLAVALAKVGNRVSAVCPKNHPLLKTSAVGQTFRYSGLRPLESLAAAIEATDPDCIIPTDDRAVGHLHELHAWARRRGSQGSKIASLIEKSLGAPESYPIVSSRCDFLRIAAEEGLRVPATEKIDSASELNIRARQQTFPVVLKADGTFNGLGVRIAHNPSEAERFWHELTHIYQPGVARVIKRLVMTRDPFWIRSWWKGVRPTVTVQAYVRGRPANCGVVCREGKVLAGISVEVVSLKRPTAPASVVRVVDHPEMMHCAERIASRLNLSGFFGLDFMIEDATDFAYLIEINPRPTRLSCLRLGKGRDPIAAFYAQISGQPIQEAPPATLKKLIAYFPEGEDSGHDLVESSFSDIPNGEPELVEELRRQWRANCGRTNSNGTLDPVQDIHSGASRPYLRQFMTHMNPVKGFWRERTPQHSDVAKHD